MLAANNNASKTIAAIADRLSEGLRSAAARGELLNEAATLDLLIKPTLEALGYPPTHRIPEHGQQRNRLDDSCYLSPVTERPGYAAIIVEAKQLNADFDRQTPGQGRGNSPDRQIKRYLERHAASGPNTLGVLTDGVRWRIYRRTGDPVNPDTEWVAEHDFRGLADFPQNPLTGLSSDLQKQLADLVDRLSLESINYRTAAPLTAPAAGRVEQLFSVLVNDPRPESVLRQLVNDPNAVAAGDLSAAITLQGKQLDAHDKDWNNYAYTRGLSLKSDNPALLGKRAVVAAAQYQYDENTGLSRPDVALAARTFANADSSRVAVLLAYTVGPEGAMEARLAVSNSSQVNMTTAFDPALAAPSARTAVAQMLQLLQQPNAALTADQLTAPLEAAPLRQQFYRQIAQWTGRQQRGKDQPQREAVLRHLIRVMFAWILKEENLIPPELFEQAFANPVLTDINRYHQEVLRFLFHRRLNAPNDQREAHPDTTISASMERVPFLNGSLFSEHFDDAALRLSAAEYWSSADDRPGLFTLLSRYHWTLDEHRPGESEQTLDPELLSNLFERLITPTEEGSEPPLRQPKGTYYTPADVADEMVKDALTAAVRAAAPSHVTDAQLLELFGSPDAPSPQLTKTERNKLTQRIQELRIFDPAVGSGEFLFSILIALQRALSKLEPDAANSAADIIRRHLAGQDINPLAVQITRLRLFIAIIAARRQHPEPEPEPLPNLEARIVCADTLQTVADPQWRPDRTGQLADADPELIFALTAAAENRANWFDAHTEEAKQAVLRRDAELRSRLQTLLQQRADLVSPELVGFAQTPLYAVNPAPARTDARLLFYENPWRGFDIVIGNPPYEALSKSMDKTAVNNLRANKRYQSTNVGDLYSLFCETALALAKPGDAGGSGDGANGGGVVTLIVPLSIAFGRSQRTVRQAFESQCQEISLRHYDNIPDTIFNGTPVLKDWKNRQRATVITGVLGQAMPIIRSTGLQGWPAAERAACLAQRQLTLLPPLGAGVDRRIAGQWLRIPTPEVAQLVVAITAQDRTVMSYAYAPAEGSDDGEFLAFPQTAYQFIGVIPAGTVFPRRETLLRVKDQDDLRLLMAVLNGHVGYAWWWMVGDGFHVKPIADHGTLTVPNLCSNNPTPMIEMGQRLIDAMPECLTGKKNSGTTWRNVNFHLKPALIEELDRMHLAALGFSGAAQDTLLRQLRIMRSSSSWNYAP